MLVHAVFAKALACAPRYEGKSFSPVKLSKISLALNPGNPADSSRPPQTGHRQKIRILHHLAGIPDQMMPAAKIRWRFGHLNLVGRFVPQCIPLRRHPRQTRMRLLYAQWITPPLATQPARSVGEASANRQHRLDTIHRGNPGQECEPRHGRRCGPRRLANAQHQRSNQRTRIDGRKNHPP